MKSATPLKTLLLAAGATLLIGAPASFAEDDAGTYAQFATSAEVSSYNVDYKQIRQFSQAFGQEERGRTKIAYAAVNAQGERFLKQYTTYLSRVPVDSLSRDAQLAYWLNTRNMLIMDAMIDARSRRSMKRSRGTFAAPGAMWTEKRVTIDGVELSIQDIEKDIILANFSDNPNVIFGLYQGTSGGPGFPAKGFSASNVNAELQAAGEAFVNSRNGLKVRRTTAQIPAIYGWYGDAVFNGDQEAIRAHLSGLSSDKTATRLASATQFEPRKFSFSSDEYIIRQQAAPAGGGGFGGGGGGGGGGGS